MRLFQNAGLAKHYRKQLDSLAQGCTTFETRLTVFLQDRYGASHFLKPVLDRQANAFVTNGDDSTLQRYWATEHGMSVNSDHCAILLAQIEEHRTEIFYNLDPVRYGSAFIRKLPSCVKKSICWRAAPSPRSDFGSYDLVVCNFPGIIDSWRRMGYRAAYFAPGHDPVMDGFADQRTRPIDVLFVGTYTRYHVRRARVLEEVATLASRHRIVFHLDQSRLNRLAESPIGSLLPIGEHRRPNVIRRISSPPIFGRELYAMISRSKIVLNGSIDMSGNERGNMRCFEAMGCGALMVSDRGTYPSGFEEPENMLTYDSPAEASAIIAHALSDDARRNAIASRGHAMVRAQYSKEAQWEEFVKLIGHA